MANLFAFCHSFVALPVGGGESMVIVKLDRVPKPRQAAKGPERRCMNCGGAIDSPFGSIDARRFCCSNCKEEYMAGPK